MQLAKRTVILCAVPIDENGLSSEIRSIDDYIIESSKRSMRDTPGFVNEGNELFSVYQWVRFTNSRGMNAEERRLCYSDFLQYCKTNVEAGMIELPDRQKKELRRLSSENKGSYECSQTISQWLSSSSYQLRPIECIISVFHELIIAAKESISHHQSLINVFYTINELLTQGNSRIPSHINISRCVDLVLPELIQVSRLESNNLLNSCMTTFIRTWTNKGLISSAISSLLDQPVSELAPSDSSQLITSQQSLAINFFKTDLNDISVGSLADMGRMLPFSSRSLQYVRHYVSTGSKSNNYENKDDDNIKDMIRDIASDEEEYHESRWQSLFK